MSKIFLAAAATGSLAALMVAVPSAQAAPGVRVTLLTLLPAAVGRGEPVAMRIKLWRPAPGGLCYRPDPVSKPNDCAYPKRGTPLPLCCLSPIVLIRNDASGAARRLRALPIKRYALDGRYQALIQFPTRGAWSVWVDDRHGGLHDLGVIHASR